MSENSVSSIDVGYKNFSAIVLIHDERYNIKKVSQCRKIDITQFCCQTNITQFCCQQNICELHHKKCAADYLGHVFTYYSHLFNSDTVLVERQPPEGYVEIEQIIFFNYREKSELISPNSVHAYLGLGNLDYEDRKDVSVKIARPYLEQFDDFKNNERKHDMADAFCMILYFLNKKRRELYNREAEERMKESKFFKDIQSFVYVD